jgi:uncharacterized protein YabN with tetrapyrrole methylase and pyrophosphatase domain
MNPLIYSLDQINKIETIQFKWKEIKNPPKKEEVNCEYYGFKAQNLKKLFPELVLKIKVGHREEITPS